MAPRAVLEPAERGSLLAGAALAAAAAVVLASLLAASPTLVRAAAAQAAAHFVLGKETGIPVGLAAGSPPALAAFLSFAQDGLVLLLGYPLLAAAARGVLALGPLSRLAARVAPPTGLAERTETAGVALLAATVWIPFLPTGALVAALAGRALGYRARILLPALAASILGATVAFTALAVAAGALLRDPLVVAALAALAAIVAGIVVKLRGAS